ncbi:tWiK family of potassium channels protein 7 [Elysia marginata]|uniref:TWiK family of potassium channels protein 7 n=1 Tax=Elysia marginata TaxID=1093978 RepID=A0AAV4HI05_9GAST|nr:tWiK family of potassium channels protein 7 [Elysia marginata]
MSHQQPSLQQPTTGPAKAPRPQLRTLPKPQQQQKPQQQPQQQQQQQPQQQQQQQPPQQQQPGTPQSTNRTTSPVIRAASPIQSPQRMNGQSPRHSPERQHQFMLQQQQQKLLLQQQQRQLHQQRQLQQQKQIQQQRQLQQQQQLQQRRQVQQQNSRSSPRRKKSKSSCCFPCCCCSSSGDEGSSKIAKGRNQNVHLSEPGNDASHIASLHRTRRSESKGKQICKKFITFLFSQVGMGVLVVGYSIMGGFLFNWLESSEEAMQKKKVNVTSFRENAKDQLWNVTVEFNVLFEQNWTMEADRILTEFQNQVHQAVKNGSWDGNDLTAEQMWSFAGSLLYCITVITTIVVVVVVEVVLVVVVVVVVVSSLSSSSQL